MTWGSLNLAMVLNVAWKLHCAFGPQSSGQIKKDKWKENVKYVLETGKNWANLLPFAPWKAWCTPYREVHKIEIANHSFSCPDRPCQKPRGLFIRWSARMCPWLCLSLPTGSTLVDLCSIEPGAWERLWCDPETGVNMERLILCGPHHPYSNKGHQGHPVDPLNPAEGGYRTKHGWVITRSSDP